MSRRDIFANDQPLSNGDLAGKYRNSWIEESIAIESGSEKQLTTVGTNAFLGRSISLRIIKIFKIIIFLGVLILTSRVLYLQLVKGDEYLQLAEGNRIRLKPIIAERGIIFDRFGKQLVQNVPSFSLAIVPQDLPRNLGQKQFIIERLAEISGLTVDEINEKIKKYGSYSYQSLVLKENLDYETALQLYVKNSSLPGVLIESGVKRDYIFSHQENVDAVLSWSHILGYSGKLNDAELDKFKDRGYLLSDNIGKTGLEKQYEEYLRGIYGKKKVEVNALGKESNVVAEEAPTPGYNLWLTIDAEAQKKMDELVKAMAEKIGQRRISAIAMDPRDGAILAMVSWPAFDENLFIGGISQDNYTKLINDKDHPLFNRAISGEYPSGSTVKLVMIAAALEEKIITANTSILSVGGFRVGRWFFKDWKAGGHGSTNLLKAVAWSVNTFFYYIGGGYGDFVGLGLDRMAQYFSKFNIGSTTGIDLPGESSGFIPTREWKQKVKGEPWYIGDTYNLSIGQGDLLVTPLQVAVWTAAVANSGNLVQPYIGAELKSATEKNVSLKPPIKAKNIISSESAYWTRQAARECVTTGSCYLLRNLPFASGGKTGTAQWNSTKNTHGWFTAFAPFDNPQIVVSVLVEEGGEGAYVAMPITKDFLSWWGKKYLKN